MATAMDAEMPEALGQSEAFLAFQERLSKVAAVERPVLLVGERGTGKELAARRVHYLSRRWQEPLVALNCAALSPTLIESELFGHETGAFTGATSRRRGRFEAADGGTLFLDELGNIPLQVQEKILRVVEYGCFERVGGSQAIRVDVRLVGATNADLPVLAHTGRFMRDLLDRLSFDVLFLPPLRARQEDIALLANHFASRMAFELGREESPVFSETALEELQAQTWRGNIRELKNVVERAVYQSERVEIDRFVFDPFQTPYPFPAPQEEGAPPPSPAAQAPPRLPDQGSFKERVEAFEVDLLRETLIKTRYNQRQTAETLGLSYHQFRGLYRKYGDRLRGESG